MFNDCPRPLRSLPRALVRSSLPFVFFAAWACGGDDATTAPSSPTSSTTSTGAGGSGPTSGSAGSMGTAGSGVTSGTGGSSTTTGGTSTPAQITTIAIYQGVQINLMKDGMAVSKLNGPIVKNRPAMMPVWVEPGAGWAAHDVTAQLE